MTGELGFAQHFPVGGADSGEGAAAKAGEETFGGRLVPDIVSVIAEANGPDEMKVGCVKRLQPFALPVRDRDKLRVRHDGDPLRLAKTRQALDVSAGLEIEDFDRIVAECRDEQSLRARIECQMIDAALDARKVDGADQVKRCLTSGRLEREQA